MAHLSLVPTPIGNLADISLRALETLRAAEVIAAEDTRHSRKLLEHYGIATPLVRLDAHTIAERGPAVLAAHERVAFISDAGTPGISDPGADLLRLALSRGDSVEVLPGATAFVPALLLSGLPTARFAFEGFLPRKGAARRERLARIAAREETTLLYEAPQRVLATLRDLLEACGEGRRASVSRELSKRFETTYRGTLAELPALIPEAELRGEFVLVVAPAEAREADVPDFATQAERLAAQGLEPTAIRKALVALGAPRNEAYALSLEVTNKSKASPG